MKSYTEGWNCKYILNVCILCYDNERDAKQSKTRVLHSVSSTSTQAR